MPHEDVLLKLALEHGTPLVVVDHLEIRKNYKLFTSSLPRVRSYYAVKANPDPPVVETLFEMGSAFDIASMAELCLVEKTARCSPKSINFDGLAFVQDRVIYAHPIKPMSSLVKCSALGVLLTYDNEREIDKIVCGAPDSRLLLRLSIPCKGSTINLSSKFGAKESDADFLIETAYDRGLDVVGVSFHVGSQNTNTDSYREAIRKALKVFNRARDMGYPFKIFDIGGGFPVSYTGLPTPFGVMLHNINMEIADLPDDVDVIAEPGRCLVASAATGIASVIGKSFRHGRPCYYVNDSVYHSYPGVLSDVKRFSIRAFKDGVCVDSIVYGQTCDSLDTIATHCMLPELEIGDSIYVEKIGAYNYTMATNFNGFPPAKVVHINQ